MIDKTMKNYSKELMWSLIELLFMKKLHFSMLIFVVNIIDYEKIK